MKTLVPWLSRKYVRYGLAYMFLLCFSVHLSAPYFSPFMLKELDLSYVEFTGLLAVAFATRALSGYVFQGITKKHGIQMLFAIGCLLIVPLPALWVWSSNYVYLAIFQALSGFAWGAHEMGLMLFLMETMEHDERSRLLTWNNVAASFGMLSGVACGWYLAGSSDPNRDAYHNIFLISTGLRILPLLMIGGFIDAIKPGNVRFRLLGIRPGGLFVMRPIFSRAEGDPDRKSDERTRKPGRTG